VLPEPIHNKINLFKRFDSGTQYTLGPFCRLARGNPQWPGVLDWFSEYEIPRFNFLLDLKMQSKHCDKNRPFRMYTKLFGVKKWLNMEPKTDKENRSCDDIAFLSEIIANSRYWQVMSSTIEIPRQYPAKTPPNKKTYLAYPAILKKVSRRF